MKCHLIVLGAILYIGFVGSIHADEVGRITETATIDIGDEVGNLSSFETAGAQTADRHLNLSERITFEPFDPELGELLRARVEVELYVDQEFSGVVGDGSPLEEVPGRVAITESLSTRLDIVGPNGAFLSSQVLQTSPAGCVSRGACAFSHRERHTVRLSFDLSPSAFSDQQDPRLSIRATTVGGVLAQICAPKTTWDRCQVRQAGVRITAPEGGIRLSYEYAPSSLKRANNGLHAASADAPRRPHALFIILLGLGIVAGCIIAARHWVALRTRHSERGEASSC